VIDPLLSIGNTSRADALLVAFAARRAIENGTPLGYVTDQLRLRFGTSQPQAVVAILQAAQAPVTIELLQTELTAIDNLLVRGNVDEALWAKVKREFSELFVLRKSDSPSLAPTQRMLRAHALVESGNISEAIKEISAMPGASSPAALNWLAKARRYQQTRIALDTLERSALALPADVPLVPSVPAIPTIPFDPVTE
jgi:hypothetical protein